MSASEPAIPEPHPVPEPATIVYLAAHRGQAERDLLERWVIHRHMVDRAPHRLFLFPRSDAPSSEEVARLVASLGDPGTVLAPLRVTWIPAMVEGRRTARWLDVLLLRNPRRPGEATKRRLLAENARDRWAIVEGQVATLSQLRARWMRRTGGEAVMEQGGDFAHYVARQAELSLERAEYPIHGTRYKLPQVDKQDVMATPGFREGLARLAAESGGDVHALRRRAETYLHELRTERSPLILDLTMRLFRWSYSRAYGEIDVVPEELAALRPLFARHSALILPAHKTNLDGPIVETVLFDNGLPPASLFGGVNMSFWPMGPILRKGGKIFLRRGIQDDPLYRFVLREYLAYLVERRFNLSWFPEGTRSRTGKLLPPKLGLMAYVVEAYRDGRIEDLALVPIALVYDQVYETADFIREAAGGRKRKESFGWMLSYLRALRRPYGKAYLRVGQPISMREALGPPEDQAPAGSAEARLAMQKLALAVSWRTNEVTPITGIALASFALLASGGRAVPQERIARYLALVVDHARRRGCPLADSAMFDQPGRLDAALATLVAAGVATRFDEGPQPVFAVGEGQHLAAAFYRNSMLHFVLERAIAELAVTLAAAAPPDRRETMFTDMALRLREALKFDFFFRERPEFEQALDAELARIHAHWREELLAASGPEDAFARIFGVGMAHGALRSFLEAYQVVADCLLDAPGDVPVDEKALVAQAQARGRQYVLEHRIRNAETVSLQVFGNAVDLARNLRLLTPGPDIAARRAELAMRLAKAHEALELIERLSVAELERRIADQRAG
ncbi:MAG: glycerol-3-phosphate 1-O-acyltransferase [Sphingomonadales bacterium]|nr:glycerol-3-phosphate 1-O-acyltransferase [Sphingomonadales bacterium]MBD3775297.1 glycerol-3-phosphate 1-O-acyltransferase [Paracoccaceae bacterium]